MDSLLQLLKIRRAEFSPVLLLSSYFFLALACTSIIKSLQNSLYLGKIGFDWRLPALYVGIALLSGPVVISYRFLAERRSHLTLSSFTILFLIGSVATFYVLLRGAQGWVYPVFYTWGGVFTVLLPIQGWMISYDLFHTREAKRLFAIFGTGGILGGAFGGFYTATLAAEVGNEGLLLHVCLLLVLAQALLVFAYRSRKLDASVRTPDDESKWNTRDKVSFVSRFRDSRYLRLLATLVLVTGLATTVIDLLYKWILERRYVGSELEITQFFGSLLGFIFLFSALLHLVGTSRFLRRYGVGIGLLVLPVGIFLGAVGVAITAAFWAVILLKVIDGALRTSLDRTSIELLYIPVAGTGTAPIKSLIDLGVFRLGDGIGAGAFLILSLIVTSPVRIAGVLVSFLSVLWLWAALTLGREYFQTLRQSLEDRALPSDRTAFPADEAVAEQTLLEALQSDNPEKVRFALRELSSHLDTLPERPTFVPLDGDIMGSSMSGISISRPPRWIDIVSDLTRHRDPNIAADAIRIMIDQDPERYEKALARRMGDERGPSTRCLIYLNRYREDPGSFLSRSVVEKWSSDLDQEDAVVLARLMGRSRNQDFLPLLEEWLKHPDKKRAAAATVALGRYRDPKYQTRLLAILETPWGQQPATKALSYYGDSLIPELNAMLKDRQVSIPVRRQIPFIFTRIRTKPATDALVSALYHGDSMLSFNALKGLNKIRARQGLNYPSATFLPLLQIWSRQYFELLHIQMNISGHGGLACRLLDKAVSERLEWTLEKIFRALGLFIPQRDAYISYLGYTSDHGTLRENAIELIDSHIKGELRQTLLPIIVEEDAKIVAARGQEIFQLPEQPDEILTDILQGGDDWLKCCVIAAAATHGIESLHNPIADALNDIHPMVRETALWALDIWNGSSEEFSTCSRQ